MSDNNYIYDEKNNVYIDKKKRKLSALLSLLPMLLFSILCLSIPVTFVKLICLVCTIVCSILSKKFLKFFDNKLKVIKNA